MTFVLDADVAVVAGGDDDFHHAQEVSFFLPAIVDRDEGAAVVEVVRFL